LSDRRRLLIGYVAVSAQLSALFKDVVGDDGERDAELFVADASNDSARLLYPDVKDLGSGPEVIKADHIKSKGARSFAVTDSIDFAGRKWHLVSAPTDTFLQDRAATGSTAVLASGVGLAVIVFGTLMYLVRRTRSTQQQVSRHTEALQQANESLRAKTEALEESRREAWEAKVLAEQANEAKGKFLGHMSHELRTPLNAVLGFTKLLGQTDLDVVQGDYLETIEQSADGLLRVVEQLLDVSRFDRGEGALEARHFELRPLLEEACAVYRRRARREQLDFDWAFADDLPEEVKGDPDRLRQVIDNVVGNAIKFTHRGEVTIAVDVEERREECACLRFEVSDTGIGIPEEQQEMIFDAFSRVEDPLSRQYGGVGLGLTVAKSLVVKMNGRIWFESRLGEGSTFYFTVELVEVEKDGRGEASKGEVEREAPLSVLLVEDSEINRKLVLRLLEKRDHCVDVAVDGQEALERFEPGKYDLVLMDVQLPRLSGLEATRRIRRSEKDGDSTPVVALTAHAREEDRADIFEAGVDYHLPKPLDPNELYELLDRIARGESLPDPATT
ncbi:MAG: ATP-binding protein, partial [Persicimonas sp.]